MRQAAERSERVRAAPPPATRRHSPAGALRDDLRRRLAALESAHLPLERRQRECLCASLRGVRLRAAARELGWSVATLRHDLRALRRSLEDLGAEPLPRSWALWGALHAHCCLGQPSLLSGWRPCHGSDLDPQGPTSGERVLVITAYALGFPLSRLASLAGASEVSLREVVRGGPYSGRTSRWGNGTRLECAAWVGAHRGCCVRRALSADER